MIGVRALELLAEPMGWLILGIVLILSELILPGLISIFMGIAALLLAGIIGVGFISNWMSAVIAWMVLSIVLIITLRAWTLKIWPGETSKGSMDEDEDAKGSLVNAVTDITSDEIGGQINFRDALWQARTDGRVIKNGETVRLVKRSGLVWTVSPINSEIK